YVLIHGKKAKVLGKICMDQFMVDVTDIPDVKEGDLVTLIGKDGDEEILLDDISALSGRFNYEFVCCLGNRIKRIYN
ncbi:MAG: alanine racemase, partial [Lachnospiraceae bacterium]|nr:alanine racemase [Lachnospiraceae bacterium]